MSFATACSICSGRKGFTIQAFAPAIWPSFFRLSRDSVVNMMIGMKRYSWRFFASFTNEMPSMTGMFTSQIARWMRLPSSLSSACLPSAAWIDFVAGALQGDADHFPEGSGVVDHENLLCHGVGAL